MKIRLEKDLQLIITPESYVEQVALQVWASNNDACSGLLIEAYNEEWTTAGGPLGEKWTIVEMKKNEA